MARRSAASLVLPALARQPMKPPAKLSPAPVGSWTSSSGYAGTEKTELSCTILAPCSPRTLVIKRGEHGAMMVHDNSVFSVPAYPLEEVHDPTRAGDSFAGGFMGCPASAGSTSDAAVL